MWDYAQQGRELYRGHGFTSLFVYPIVLHYGGNGYFYNLWRPPLYPLLVSQSFRFTDIPSIHTLIYLTGLFYVFTAILITLIVETMVDKRIAWMAGFFYVGSVCALQSRCRPVRTSFCFPLDIIFLSVLRGNLANPAPIT